MKRADIIALTGLVISATMISIVAINDNRLNGKTSKKPFLTEGQQEKLLKSAIVPVSLTAIFVTWMFANSIIEYNKLK